MKEEQSLVSLEYTPRPPTEMWERQKKKKRFCFSVFRGSMTLLTTEQTSGIKAGKDTFQDVRLPSEVLCHRAPQNAQCLLSVFKTSSTSNGMHGLSREPLLPTGCPFVDLAHLPLTPLESNMSQFSWNSVLPRHRGCNIPEGYRNTRHFLLVFAGFICTFNLSGFCVTEHRIKNKVLVSTDQGCQFSGRISVQHASMGQVLDLIPRIAKIKAQIYYIDDDLKE